MRYIYYIHYYIIYYYLTHFVDLNDKVFSTSTTLLYGWEMTIYKDLSTYEILKIGAPRDNN